MTEELKSPSEVNTAFYAGTLTREEAMEVLRVMHEEESMTLLVRLRDKGYVSYAELDLLRGHLSWSRGALAANTFIQEELLGKGMIVSG